jgi:hypothetical protein
MTRIYCKSSSFGVVETNPVNIPVANMTFQGSLEITSMEGLLKVGMASFLSRIDIGFVVSVHDQSLVCRFFI